MVENSQYILKIGKIDFIVERNYENKAIQEAHQQPIAKIEEETP